MNNSKVLPARLFGEKEGTGAKVEFLLIKRMEGGPMGDHGQTGQTSETRGFRCFQRQFPGRDLGLRSGWHQGLRSSTTTVSSWNVWRNWAKMPLPPYIERESTLEDKDMYQTVYCKRGRFCGSADGGAPLLRKNCCKRPRTRACAWLM